MVVTYPQWMLFGDSITQQSFLAGGLGQQLADTYQRQMDIVNRGYGGYNSKWGLRVAPHVLPLADSRKTLKAINIWFGANDATLPTRPQSITTSEYKENLHTLVEMLRSSSSAFYSPDTIIIILSPPPICAPQRREDVRNRWGEVELDRTPERTKEFARAAEEVAKELNVGFVPVFDAIMTAAGPDPDVGLQKYFTDGLHLTASGYQIVHTALITVLHGYCPQLLPDNMPRLFPDWAQIDPHNPDASFPKP